jgi:hypothetical protein
VKTSARLVPAAPDGLPLFGYAPGFEEGRIVVAVGEMQHALGFARSGASRSCCSVLLWLTPQLSFTAQRAPCLTLHQ